MNKMRQANNHAMMNDAQVAWQYSSMAWVRCRPQEVTFLWGFGPILLS